MEAPWLSDSFTIAVEAIKTVFGSIADFFTGVFEKISGAATSFFEWIGSKLQWVTDGLQGIADFCGGAIDNAGEWFKGIGDKLENFVGLDTGGYVKTTGLAVLHPNEVVVNDDTTKRLQNFLGMYENSKTGIVSESTPTQAVMNNIYPTVMESVPVTTVPATDLPKGEDSSFISNTQNIIKGGDTKTVETSGDVHNDYSVTFAAGSVIIQIPSTSDTDLEKAAEKIMKIIARKQQLRSMAVRK